jgi:signal transduction histidine kinase
LAIVHAYLDLLGEAAMGVGEPARASAKDWWDAALEQVTRLDRLVDGILVAVRRDGVGELAREPFDVVSVIREAITELTPLFRAHPLGFSPPAEELFGVGDRLTFRQVLEHLLENESKYAPTGGGVYVGAYRQDTHVHVWITDEGPGVPREEWEHVFEAFVRVEGGRARGSGIGLFAARRLMEGMGGRVWLEPNGYGGSRFVLALPASPS